MILALERAIDNPTTPKEKRAEYSEDLGSVAMGFIDILDEEEEREYEAKIDPKDLLTEAEWLEFINRKRS